MHRVVITGIGVVSPVGSTLSEFWSGLLEARSGIGPLTRVPRERLNVHIAAEVAGFAPEAHFEAKRAGSLDRFSQFAVVAARAAVRDAGLTIAEEVALKTAVIIGNTAGGQTTVDESYFRLYGENAKRVHPMTIPRWMVNAASSQISIDLGLKGPNWTVASACASATHAIGQAFHMLRLGQAPLAIAGGAEACLTLGTLKSWEAMRVLATDTCRPFSLDRSGLVLGEGAAMLVLETRAAAVARGARIYAELIGFGMSADAGEMITSDPDGAARAMRAALKDAQASPDDIDYINAHGTGTRVGDRMETQAIRGTFASAAERLAVSSSKAVLGHSLGAAGAQGLAAAALALHDQTLPPTANFSGPDPECDLDFVPNVARQATIRMAMSNAFAFGGLNAVLVLGRA
jgi:nodulation protein E